MLLDSINDNYFFNIWLDFPQSVNVVKRGVNVAKKSISLADLFQN